MSVGSPTDDSLRYCFRTLPCCPACGSIDFKIYKTSREGESKTQWCECRATDPETQEPICRNKFKIVWAVPLGGIDDDDLD